MEFYVLEPALYSRYDVEVVVLDPVYGEPPSCPACSRPIGNRAWLPPHRASLLAHGEAFGDVAFGAGTDPVFSARLVACVRACGCRGFAGAAPIRIDKIRARSAAPATTEYVVVPIKTGPARIDEAKSRIRREKPIECPVCMHGGLITLVEGIVIANATWAGDDVFHVLGLPGITLVSANFREAVASAGLVGLHLRPVQEYVWDPHHTRGPATPPRM